tara:strand:+ start:14096 stop:14632 length:537 start_codon:yes stop_codon:yes gene_type:complete
MAVCKNCKQNFEKMRLLFYKNGIKAMKESRFGSLPKEIFYSIVEMVFPKAVTLHFTYKTRYNCQANWSTRESNDDNDDDHHDDDDDDDNYAWVYDGFGYNYINQTANLCSKCFLEGIMRVYRRDGLLPFMIWDTKLFFNKTPITVCPYKFQLPASYYVDYYRRKRPVMYKGKLYITNR